MPNTAKNSSSAGEISGEFGGLNALMNSLPPPRSRHDTTVVADSIQNNYACHENMKGVLRPLSQVHFRKLFMS